MIGCALLIFCLLLPVVSKRLLRNSSGVFEATRTKASPVLLSYGAALAAALSLTVVLLHTFPLPVILALLINELKNKRRSFSSCCSHGL